MTHQMKLGREWFDKIAAGKKVFEARLNDKKRRNIKAGDEIEFSTNDEPAQKMQVRVISTQVFRDFRDMLTALDVEKFGDHSPDSFLSVLSQFYSEEDQEKYGVMAMGVERI